jgi:hypothetical protein
MKESTMWRALISIPIEAATEDEALEIANRIAADTEVPGGGNGYVELLAREGEPIAYEDPAFRRLHGLSVS